MSELKLQPPNDPRLTLKKRGWGTRRREIPRLARNDRIYLRGSALLRRSTSARRSLVRLAMDM